MKLTDASYHIIYPDLDDPATAPDIYKRIEQIGRTCYKSEDKITDGSAEKFVRGLIKSDHTAMIEHAYMTVKFICDRGVSHELVRHRLCSFAQESQRYCAYNKDKFGHDVTFIWPCYFKNASQEVTNRWLNDVRDAEQTYFELLKTCSPEEARAVLPNSTKTEIVVTANMREWRHIFKLRALGTTGRPHPQMLELMVPLANECAMKLPAIFEDLKVPTYKWGVPYC